MFTQEDLKKYLGQCAPIPKQARTKLSFFGEILQRLTQLNQLQPFDSYQDCIDFIERQRTLWLKRIDDTQMRWLKKKEKHDEVEDDIYNLLGNSSMTLDDIVRSLNVRKPAKAPPFTRNKISPKLTRMIDKGLIEKKWVRINRQRKFIYWRINPEDQKNINDSGEA